MNELATMANNLGLSVNISREKNLYKVQNLLCPQVFKGKNVEDIKKEIQKSVILFYGIDNQRFLELLQVAMETFVIEKKMDKNAIFSSEYILSCSKLLDYIKRNNINTMSELTNIINNTVVKDYREECLEMILLIFKNSKKEIVYDPLKHYQSQEDPDKYLDNIRF